MSIYVDHMGRQSPDKYACFRANGIDGVCRYLDGGRVSRKGLLREEAEAISAAGLRIHTVYETSGGADIEGFAPDGDYFTREQGRRDWLEAVVDATRAGQPRGYPIYLAVDRHMPPEDPRLDAYFGGALSADVSLGASGYHLGCYGPDYVCRFVRDALGVTHLWPWLPRPPGRPDFDFDLWQYENGASVCGVAVDYNECRLKGWTLMPEELVTREELEAYQAEVRATLEAMKAVEIRAIEALRAIRDALKDI